jgi:hypothetical protein
MERSRFVFNSSALLSLTTLGMAIKNMKFTASGPGGIERPFLPSP